MEYSKNAIPHYHFVLNTEIDIPIISEHYEVLKLIGKKYGWSWFDTYKGNEWITYITKHFDDNSIWGFNLPKQNDIYSKLYI